MTEELENIYDAMVQAAQRGDVRGAMEYADGMSEKEKIVLMAHATHRIRIHEVLREGLIVHADKASPHADRQSMYRACGVHASTFYRWLDRLGLPRNRKGE